MGQSLAYDICYICRGALYGRVSASKHRQTHLRTCLCTSVNICRGVLYGRVSASKHRQTHLRTCLYTPENICRGVLYGRESASKHRQTHLRTCLCTPVNIGRGAHIHLQRIAADGHLIKLHFEYGCDGNIVPGKGPKE